MVDAVAKSGAGVVICPTTEANLGDGFFPARDFLRQGGAIGVGSDSQISVSPIEELRWLESRTDIRSLRAAVCDLNGVMRGKRIPLDQAEKVLSGSLRMPLSVVGVVGVRIDAPTRVGRLGYWVGRRFWSGSLTRAPLSSPSPTQMTWEKPSKPWMVRKVRSEA